MGIESRRRMSSFDKMNFLMTDMEVNIDILIKDL